MFRSISRRRRISSPTTLAVIGVSAMLVAACGASDSAGGEGGTKDLITVTIAQPTPSATPIVGFLPAGIEKGFFRDQGIDLKVKYIAGAANVITAVQTGQADLGYSAPEQLTLAVAKGAKLTSVYQLTSRVAYSYGFIEGNKIQGPKDITGAKIGVTSTSSNDTYLAYINSDRIQLGLPKIEASQLVPIGEGAQASLAVKSGKVDAVFFQAASLQALLTTGIKLNVAPVESLTTGYPGLMLAASEENVDKKADALRKTLKGIAASIKFCVDNEKECMDTFAKVEPASIANRPVADAQWSATAGLLKLDSGAVVGRSEDQVWEAVSSLLVASGGLKTPIPAGQLYTNALVAK